VTGPQDIQTRLAMVAGLEQAMDDFAADWKFIPTLPRGPHGERAILLMDFLIPDLQHIVATHYISRGWRRHDEFAVFKPRRIVGGAFEDLVAYVPVAEPDDPIVVGRDEMPDMTVPPDMADLLWKVTPEVSETFEERT
jgi:hypothetical protein